MTPAEGTSAAASDPAPQPAPAAPRFGPGERVRVRDDWPERRGPCHIRTPHYLRGRVGTVQRLLGRFANPEELAFGHPAPARALYHVLFEQPPIWHEGHPGDEVLVELFEHWLEPDGTAKRSA
ncbi:nitrile hydratase subunit beta [Roseomonas nepalensis]|uniref:Nitrile hydratase subunit beta n=1 Tax=Muricoccus nepalensis TaxID=1854500 RepID=A0A502G5E8_9PROT|nr:SH3-like domain-containing protein [Roseomonas nepalensis]TPG57135.1 nitrile hydratase subunit beta [Roseomonas nepalensis]